MFVVADQLGRLRNTLCDIGTPKDILQQVALRRLKVAEIASEAFGIVDWVVHNLWQSAADGIFDGCERTVTAHKAANAARTLSSLGSETQFYRACSIHYDALSLDSPSPDITLAVMWFRQNVSKNSPPDQVEEMLRAILSQSRLMRFGFKQAKLTCNQLSWRICNPTWTMLCADICANMEQRPVSNNKSLKKALRLNRRVICILEKYQDFRPTRIRPLLAHTHFACARHNAARNQGSLAEKDFWSAIELQTSVVKIGQFGDLETLRDMVQACVEHRLKSKRWNKALVTVKQSLELVKSHPPAKSVILSAGFDGFRRFLESSRDVAALPATWTFFDTLGPFHRSNCVQVLLSVVDFLTTLSSIYREIGKFLDALKTSGNALDIALELYSQYPRHVDYYFKALACHANSASADEKDAISHRGRALRSLAPRLVELLDDIR